MKRTLKKRPIQIYLDKKQDEVLKYLAEKMGVSKAELIRRSVNDFLREKIPIDKDPALEIIGLGGKIGISDLSIRHDEYLIKIERKERIK